jgi:2-C-methyl-D-erythritol 4-phosphate cytidylyltransferase
MTSVTLVRCGDVADPERIWTIVVGGGSGRRFGSLKQYETLGDRRVIDHARAAAEAVSDGTVLVVPAADAERERGVAGGESRSASVRAGLASVPADATVILVHDAARPFADAALFRRVIEAVRDGADGAIPGLPVADTIKVVDDGLTVDGTVDGRRVVVDTPDRATLVAVQTPQGFRADALRSAHRGDSEATDDSALVERAGGQVVVVAGDHDNRKITRPEDLAWAREILAARGNGSET